MMLSGRLAQPVGALASVCTDQYVDRDSLGLVAFQCAAS